MRDSLAIKAVTNDHCVAEWDAFVIVVWRQLTTPEGVARVAEALDRAVAANRRIGVVILIEPTAAPPAAAERKGLAEVFSTRAEVVDAVAVIPQGSGFRASMVRGVVTGLSLISRFPYPYKVFGNLDVAAGWLTPQVDGGATKATLLSNTLAQLRRQLESPAGAVAVVK